MFIRKARRTVASTGAEALGKLAQRSRQQDSFFWRWIEFGTAKRERRVFKRAKFGRQETGKASTGFVRPQPFVRPAIKATQGKATETLERTLRAGIKEAFCGR